MCSEYKDSLPPIMLKMLLASDAKCRQFNFGVKTEIHQTRHTHM